MPTLSETPASRAKRQRFRGAAGLLLVVHSGTEPTSVTTAFSPQATVRLMPPARVRPARWCGSLCPQPRPSGPPPTASPVSSVRQNVTVRWRGHPGSLHDRADVRLGFIEEGVEAVRVGPFVDGHVLAIRAAPAMRDEPVTLGHVHDATDRVGVRRDLLLEGRWIAAHAQGDDD